MALALFPSQKSRGGRFFRFVSAAACINLQGKANSSVTIALSVNQRLVSMPIDWYSSYTAVSINLLCLTPPQADTPLRC